MNLMPKIADRHLSRQACIYIRQSTLAQVRFNQESTDRQYNLMNKARSLGWSQEQIRVLDRDLGPVDGFDQDESASESDESTVTVCSFLAAHGDPLEAFQLADRLFDPGAGLVE